MTVSIEPTASPISDLISIADPTRLDHRKVEILSWCQSMSSEVWTGRIDGELVCIFGLIPPSLISTQAYLWMHATEKVNEHKFRFVRHSMLAVEQMLKLYPTITGHCVIGATSSIRWVKRLGAVFGEPVGPYIPFHIGKA